MSHNAYYNVCIHTAEGDETYTVCAVSDYAAARRVRTITGHMAAHENDVIRIASTFSPFPLAAATPETAQTFSPPSPVYPPAGILFCTQESAGA